MKKCCGNCSYVEFTKEDGVRCNLKAINYLDEHLDIDEDICNEYQYNKCLDCKYEECILEKCDIWD